MTISIYLTIIAIIALAFWVYLHQSHLTNYFDDGLDYSIKNPSMRLHKHIHNNIVKKNKSKNRVFYQFYKIEIPTENGTRQVESMLITNSGIYLFDTYHLNETVTYSDIGYTIKNNYKSHTKLYIPETADVTLTNNVKSAINMYGDIDVSSFNVFTSKIKFKKSQPENVLMLNEIESFILRNSKYSVNQIAQIVGAFILLNTKSKTKKAA